MLICPICSSEIIRPIMRDVRFTARVDRYSYDLTDFVAFSCSEGHAFLVMSQHTDVVPIERDDELVM